MRLTIAKCVWGERYVATMLAANLPSLLAPGNIPAAARRVDLDHLLLTTPADRVVIENHPAYQALTRLIPCRIEALDEAPTPKDYVGAIDRMNQAHCRILADCRARGSSWVFDQPDHIWGDGSLGYLANLARNGASCVLFAGIRTNREDMLTILPSWRNGEVLQLDNGALLRLAIEHMHVHDRARFWGAPVGTNGPHHVNWRVGPYSFLRRVFYAQPFLLAAPKTIVEPRRSVDLDYVERAYAPAELQYIANSRDFLVIEVSGKLEFRDHSPPPLSAPYLASWAGRLVSDRQADVFMRSIRFQGDETPERRWRRVERFSADVAGTIHRMRELRALQAALASERPALAAVLGRLLRDPTAHRRLAWKGQATFHAPSSDIAAAWLNLPMSKLLDAMTERLVGGGFDGEATATTPVGGALERGQKEAGLWGDGVEMIPFNASGSLRLFLPRS